jgi:hypothetical protein
MVLGDDPLPGTMVVDRYAGYNKTPCALQYCYEHLSREVEDLEKEFPDSDEIKSFASVMVPLLTEAMQLRNQPITDEVFYAKAAEVKDRMIAAVKATAVHMGIRCIQDIFDENAYRMYHWAEDRRVPAENNLAERDLRPTVIARKVSFGSVVNRVKSAYPAPYFKTRSPGKTGTGIYRKGFSSLYFLTNSSIFVDTSASKYFSPHCLHTSAGKSSQINSSF